MGSRVPAELAHWSELLVERLRRSHVTFVFLDQQGQPFVSQPAGTLATASGTLFTVANRFFLFTAAHVAVQVCGPDAAAVAWVLRTGELIRREQPAVLRVVLGTGQREEDAAVLELDPGWVEKRCLQRSDFLTLDNLCPVLGPEAHQPGELVAILGTPKAWSQTRPGTLTVTPLLYFTVSLGLDENALTDSFVADFSQLGLSASGDVPIPHPDGMSGGSVWLVPLGVRVEQVLMFGVQLGVYARERRLRIGPIEHWIRVLRSLDSELARAIDGYIESL
jgi:hypothetical protein